LYLPQQYRCCQYRSRQSCRTHGVQLRYSCCRYPALAGRTGLLWQGHTGLLEDSSYQSNSCPQFVQYQRSSTDHSLAGHMWCLLLCRHHSSRCWGQHKFPDFQHPYQSKHLQEPDFPPCRESLHQLQMCKCKDCNKSQICCTGCPSTGHQLACHKTL